MVVKEVSVPWGPSTTVETEARAVWRRCEMRHHGTYDAYLEFSEKEEMITAPGRQ